MANKLAMEVAGGLSSAPAEAILSSIDPRDVNVGIKNPAYEDGLSDQEFYNRKALPWEGAAYAVAGGTIVKVAGRSGAASGPEIEQQYPNLAEVWQRFAAAQQDRQANPGSLSALINDQRRVANQIGDVGTIDPQRGEGTSLTARKAAAKQR
jgi:hypothetical protein